MAFRKFIAIKKISPKIKFAQTLVRTYFNVSEIKKNSTFSGELNLMTNQWTMSSQVGGGTILNEEHAAHVDVLSCTAEAEAGQANVAESSSTELITATSSRSAGSCVFFCGFSVFSYFDDIRFILLHAD